MASEQLSRKFIHSHIVSLLHEGYQTSQIRKIMFENYQVSYSRSNAILTQIGAMPHTQTDEPQRSLKSRILGRLDRILFGAGMIIVAWIITLGSYTMAAGNGQGGSFAVATGLFLYGGFTIFQGIVSDG